MTSYDKAAVVPLDVEFDESKLEHVKHKKTIREDDGSSESTEVQVPKINDEASPYEILHFLSSFQKARSILRWTTGPKLFAKFPMHLRMKLK